MVAVNTLLAPFLQCYTILFRRQPIAFRPEFIAIAQIAKHVLKRLRNLRHRLTKCRPSICDLLDNCQNLFHIVISHHLLNNALEFGKACLFDQAQCQFRLLDLLEFQPSARVMANIQEPPFAYGCNFPHTDTLCILAQVVIAPFLPPDSSGSLVHQNNTPLDLEPGQLANIKEHIEQLMKASIFVLDVLQSFIGSRIGIALRILLVNAGQLLFTSSLYKISIPIRVLP